MLTRTIQGFILWGCGLSLLAVEPVSARFTVDLRYQPSGITAESFATSEAVGLSSRFSVLTTILKQDTDGDGIPDAWENYYGLNASVSDGSVDADGDGRSNLAEYNAGTNPVVVDDWSKSVRESGSSVVDTGGRSTGGTSFDQLAEVWARSLAFLLDTAGRAPDADKDGMPDWWETKFGLNAFEASAARDGDGDGRSDLQEYNAGTNPIVADDWSKAVAGTRDVFLTDTRVIVLGSNPTFDKTFAVIRESGRFICDTGGLYYDWDGDGIPNWWEARFARSKVDLNAADDGDGDGHDNLSEFIAYTDPTDAASVFRVTPAIVPLEQTQLAMRFRSTPSGQTGFELSWPSAKGRTYRIFNSKTPTSWPDTPLYVIDGTGEIMSVVIEQTESIQLFKVTVELTRE